MSLIRSREASGGRVRSLGAPRPPPPPPPAAPPPPDPRLAALEAEVSALRAAAEFNAAQTAAREAEVEALVRRAREDGHEIGLRAGHAEAQDGLDRLGGALEAASRQVAEDLMSLEGLAARLAREALGRILDDPAEHAPMVAAALRRQMAALASETVLAAEVSSLDFPDAEALERLRLDLGRPGLELRTAPGLGRGDARLRLQLCEVELGVPGQWARLKAALDKMFEDGKTP